MCCFGGCCFGVCFVVGVLMCFVRFGVGLDLFCCTDRCFCCGVLVVWLV